MNDLLNEDTDEYGFNSVDLAEEADEFEEGAAQRGRGGNEQVRTLIKENQLVNIGIFDLKESNI